ncbi:TATA element modulatory factor [Condylostylus longicornis]|uniref:TATA element modulatory factor n=1 Tax=Condylostylus longicornis TaxID=2530218 RepID=UPI00244D999C|nr:TATA element modulatory factor [Condylostylus longicornis]
MSWFDTAGLASLAKNALKEAQKHIDKALDIQDEDMNSSITIATSTSTTPPMPYTDNTWGSFTGSFFDNPKSDEMITTPPKSASTSSTELLSPLISPTTNASSNSAKRESINSNSDSVELILSPPTSPSVTIFNSESVEVINTPTPTTFSPTDNSCEELGSSPIDSKAKSSDSVEIIDHHEILEEDEDSMSFNTVMDDEIPLSSKNLTDSTKTLKQMQSIDQSQSTSDTLDSSCIQSKMQNSIKSVISIEENFVDSQTVLSDSTQSFENVQILDTAEHSSSHSDEKISGGQSGGNCSEHASADEIETTTSSDIEIISNPNGDSSSTNSACRITPVKYQKRAKNYANASADHNSRSLKKGHCREPSEISIQSEDSQSDFDKLQRRISELNEILENREIKLLELSRQNATLLEKNSEYKSQLDAKRKNDDSEEHTQRLSALEKKFQSTIRERDALRDQLNTIRTELSSKIPKDDLNKIIAEKDFMIEELKTEGEKLSKSVLQHSNIIKKLRAKEKESDTTLKKNKEQIESLSDEVERLKKSLTAKEEVERTQIEAINKLSSNKRKLEKENETQKSQIEDLTSKIETLRTSLDAAKKELLDKHHSHQEMSKKQEVLASIEIENKNIQSHNAELCSKLEEMREKLRNNESEHSAKEQKLRQENLDLMSRLEKSEQRCEELTNEVSLATVPLVRQLEALQSTLTNRTNSWEKHEEKLVKELTETQASLENLKHIETQSTFKETSLNTKVKNLEDQLQNALLKYEQANSELHQNIVNFEIKESIYNKKISEIELKLEESTKLVKDYRAKLQKLEEQSNQSIVCVTGSEQSEILPKDVTGNASNIAEISSGASDSNTIEDDLKQNERNQSPTFSMERNSMSESVISAWQMDDLDAISNSGRRGIGNFYEFGLSSASVGSIGSHQQMLHSTAMLSIENLQATLKQKDGELSQLQWENSRIKSERNALNCEISNLTLELENIKERMSGLDTLEKEFMELKHQYDALLQMYGEKIEEAQELELDLQDVKEMYKAQIDELLKQQKELSSSK